MSLKIFKNTFADSIVIRNSVFRDISGSVLSLNKETDDIGIYNAEYVVFENCIFSRIEGTALTLYRGGNDESTFGPILTINHCVFNEVGKGERNQVEASLALHGVQYADIRNSIFKDCAPISLFLTVGDPITRIHHTGFYNTGKIKANDKAYELWAIFREPPAFKDETQFELSEGSPLKGKGDDSEDLGVAL